MQRHKVEMETAISTFRQELTEKSKAEANHRNFLVESMEEINASYRDCMASLDKEIRSMTIAKGLDDAASVQAHLSLIDPAMKSNAATKTLAVYKRIEHFFIALKLQPSNRQLATCIAAYQCLTAGPSSSLHVPKK